LNQTWHTPLIGLNNCEATSHSFEVEQLSEIAHHRPLWSTMPQFKDHFSLSFHCIRFIIQIVCSQFNLSSINMSSLQSCVIFPTLKKSVSFNMLTWLWILNYNCTFCNELILYVNILNVWEMSLKYFVEKIRGCNYLH
jgi:hypothetical protein